VAIKGIENTFYKENNPLIAIAFGIQRLPVDSHHPIPHFDFATQMSWASFYESRHTKKKPKKKPQKSMS
jgi:hypothetical protein